MQHQDTDFVFKGVAEGGCLSPGLGGGDGYFAEVPEGRRNRLPHLGYFTEVQDRPGGLSYCGDRPGGLSYRGKGEDVGGVIFAQKIAIEAAEMAIAGDEAGERAILGDFAAQSSGEAFQVAAVQFRRGPAEQNYMVV